MPDRWMTLAAAAATLDVHPRTIERRIASGKLPSRRTDDGQLQLLIDAPEVMAPEQSPLATVKELAQDQVSIATGSASAIIRLSQADAERARHELDRVRHEVDRVRQGAKFAWIAVASMAAVVCVAIGWTGIKLTQTSEQLTNLRQVTDRVAADARQLTLERDLSRAEAESANLSNAEATGRLAAYNEQAKMLATVLAASDKRPTTPPLNLAQRIASAMAGE